MEEVQEQELLQEGTFVTSLKRNNTKIKADRAEAIAEDTEMIYRRKIEDMRIRIKRYGRNQDNMLDLSPDNALNLKPAEDHDPDQWIAKDLDLALKIREETIKLDLAIARYTTLFGGNL